MSRPLRLLVLLVSALALLAPLSPTAAHADPLPPPVGTDLDYQLGGVRGVPDHVGIVARDRRAEPVAGRYNVCYVNGFQTQPDEKRFWLERRHLLLKKGGKLVVDEAWGEWLLDIRTTEKRSKIARIVGEWTAGCARHGFDAVEFDNLDSFTRSRSLIERRDALAFAELLVGSAHDAGLAAGQKNLAGFDGTAIGFDFAVSEECARYRECGRYVASYGARVLAIEYRSRDFRRACAAHGARLSIVLRDRALRPDGVRRWC